MKAIFTNNDESMAISYDQSAVTDVTPTGKFIKITGDDKPAAVVCETDEGYVVLHGTGRLANVPQDSPLWTHNGQFRVFDHKLYDELPIVLFVDKHNAQEVTSWCSCGINWDYYYATTNEELEKLLQTAYSTDGRRRHKSNSTTTLYGIKVYCQGIHNVRW